MSRPRTRTLILSAALAVVLSLTVLFLPAGPFIAPAPSWTPTRIEVRGVFHLHTRRSDGTGTIEEVAAAAAAAGLQFVIVTDHGDATRTPDPPAYRAGVLCIDAVEISTTGGHYAALGLGPSPYPLAGEPRDVAEDVRRLGGFGVATHPLSEKADLAWRDWDVPMDAFEWLNGDSVWRDAPGRQLGRAAWSYVFRPVASVTRLYQRPGALGVWDGLNRGRTVIALAGTDAHARLGFRDGPEPYKNPLYLKLPSYRVAFGVASLRVRMERGLSGNATADAAAVLAAIRAGRVHTVVDGLGRDGAFDFTATSGGAAAGEGGTIPLSAPAVIRVRANPPPGGWVVLLRDGVQVHRVQAQELVYASDERGIYRAEVWVPAGSGRDGFVPWIVGNPIVIGDRDPVPAPANPDMSGPRFPLDAAGEMWGVEHDPASQAAADRAGGIGLTFTLAASGAAPYAALEATTSIERPATGLAFVARASRPMRISVQVRVPTAGEGLRWRRSVYLDPAPREVVVPFSEMRAVGATPEGPPQTADVRTILFVVDGVNATPGSTGHFVLNDVRLYSPAATPASK